MNKKYFSFLLFIASFLIITLFSLDTTKASGYTPKDCGDLKKVVLHYKKFDGVYTNVGIWTWSNGTNGSGAPTKPSGTDAFGSVIEICVNSDAESGNTGWFIPIADEIDSDNRWNHKDSFEGKDLSYDRTSLMDGTVSELHIYFIEGNDQVFYMDPTKPVYNKENFGTITIIYFDPLYWKDTAAYDGWDIHTWNTGTNGTQAPAPFQFDYIGIQNAKMRVAIINVASDANTEQGIGFIVKDAGWTKKFGSDIFISPTGALGSGDKVVYYVAGQSNVTESYDEFYQQVLETKDNNFVEFDPIKATGTYASSLTEIKVKLLFPVEVASTATDLFIRGADKVKLEFTEIKPVNEADGKAKEFVITPKNPLDKTSSYTIYYTSDIKMELNLDNNAPMIDYTNKVKLDLTKYDELTDTFLVEKGSNFGLSNFIRLNVVDDRDGSLLNKIVVTGTPNTAVSGDYTMTITVTDSWENTSTKEFKFKVLGTNEEPQVPTTPVVEEPVEEEPTFIEDYGILVGVIVGLVAVSTAGVFFLKRKV